MRLFLISVLFGAFSITPPYFFSTIQTRAVADDAVSDSKLSAADPLPAWNEGASKSAIKRFVEKVTKKDGPDFVPVTERIAAFDNDGTLWCEHPMYVEMAFTIDRIKALAPQHPEWKEKEPFRAILAGNLKEALASGETGAAALVAATHAGLTVHEFEKIVKDWLVTAKHPKFNRRYLDLTYQPMVELLTYLRANGFKTFIVSGGGVDFMRPWTEKAYGIPPEQVVGSRGKLKFETQAGQLVLFKLPEIDLVNDGPGKPVGIQQMIGRRPIAAFGNSDGDLQMIEWVTAGTGARFGLIVHHTDAEREFAYDRQTHVGKLDKALDLAPTKGWTVVDMKHDWKTIFPSPQEQN